MPADPPRSVTARILKLGDFSASMLLYVSLSPGLRLAGASALVISTILDYYVRRTHNIDASTCLVVDSKIPDGDIMMPDL
jgi:hypothetical protein